MVSIGQTVMFLIQLKQNLVHTFIFNELRGISNDKLRHIAFNRKPSGLKSNLDMNNSWREVSDMVSHQPTQGCLSYVGSRFKSSAGMANLEEARAGERLPRAN